MGASRGNGPGLGTMVSQFSVHGGRKPVIEPEMQESEQSFAVSIHL